MVQSTGIICQGFAHSQEFPVGLCPRVEPALSLVAGDAAVVPGHLLMGCGGNELLHLRSLAYDGLFECVPLEKGEK